MTATISRSSAILGAARTLAAKLLLAIPIDRVALTQAMTESAGASDAEGAWTQRESFEALEVALAMAIPELVGRLDAGSAIGTLEALARELPTHTVRSEDQIAFQQFNGFDDDDFMLGAFHQHINRLPDDRMRNFFQLLERRRIREDNAAEQGTVDAAIFADDELPEGVHNGFIGRGIGHHDLVCKTVGINRIRA